MEDSTTFRLRDVAKLFKITPRTLYFYEEQGLLKPSRNASNHRLYNSCDLLRLRKIRALKYFGLAMNKIQMIMQDEGSLKDKKKIDILEAHRSALSQVVVKCQRSIENMSTLIANGAKGNDEQIWQLVIENLKIG
jgi:DNA-binding transcriptional MerR regulator